MKAVFYIALNTYREAYRSKVMLSVFLFAAMIVGVAALFGSVSIGEQFRVVKSFGYTVISVSVAVATLLIGISLFQKEISQKTIFNVLSKPVSRTSFVVGKFLGLSFTSAMLALFMSVVLLLVVSRMEGHFDWTGRYFVLYVCLETLIVASLTILFSAISVTPVLPGLFAFGTYLAGKSLPYLSSFLQDIKTPFMLWIIEFLYWILPDLNLLTPYDRLVYGIPIEMSEVTAATVYTFCYVVIVLVLSVVFFQRRDFK